MSALPTRSTLIRPPSAALTVALSIQLSECPINQSIQLSRPLSDNAVVTKCDEGEMDHESVWQLTLLAGDGPASSLNLLSIHESSITCVRSAFWSSRYPFVGGQMIAVAMCPTSINPVIASSFDFIRVTLPEISYLTETSLDDLVRGWRKNQVHLEANGKDERIKRKRTREKKKEGMRHVVMEFHYLTEFEERVSRGRRSAEDYIWTNKSGWQRVRRSHLNTKRARKANDSQINSCPEAVFFSTSGTLQ